MNPFLSRLVPYPFQRLRELLSGVVPNPDKSPINLSIGEPRHATPAVVTEAVISHLDGLGQYPATQGSEALRMACAEWLTRRYSVPRVDVATQVLPVCGSREALFALAQVVLGADGACSAPVAILPNPFYQIYEGATLLAGAEPFYVNCRAEAQFKPNWSEIPESVWVRTQLVFVCSPANPTGAVMNIDDWRELFALSDRYGFVIASDECYSEIWQSEAPLGGLEAAYQLGRCDYKNLVVLTSLSKRSNAPGLRSGFVAGDATWLQRFLLYRTYHGSAMSPVVQAASIAAWNDEAHVEANRAAYREKFAAVTPIVREALSTQLPEAGFYLWAKVPRGDDAAFARTLFEQQHVTVLPGRFLARTAHGENPGDGYIRIALVAPLEDCIEAAHRIVACAADFR